MNEAAEMPRYIRRGPKIRALRIDKVEPRDGGGAIITPAEDGYEPFYVSSVFMTLNTPSSGGYYVTEGDGLEYYLPPQVFQSKLHAGRARD